MAAAAAWCVGDRVQAVYEDGNWYYASVEEVNAAEDVYLVAYEGCDLREYVYGASVRAADTPIEEAPEAGGGAAGGGGGGGAAKEQAKRRGTIRRLTLTPQMREIVKLLEAENEFSQCLELLDHYFVEPARKTMGLPPKQRMLEQDLYDTLFKQIEPIRQLSRRLLDDLEKRFDEAAADRSPLVGDVFVRFAPFFKLYTAYIAHHEKNVMPALKKLPSKFRSYVKNCEKAPELQGHTLEKLLALPTQRVSAYIDLLGGVSKVTPRGDPDAAPLERALKALADTASSVKSALSSQRNQDVIVSIEKKFIGSPGFSQPGRYIIREGALTKKPRDRQVSDRDYRFYLFNDMLAYASSIGWKMKLHGKVDINLSFHVRALPQAGREHRLLVCSSAKSFVLYAADKQSRDGWVAAIEGAIAEVRKSITEQQRRVPPPVAPLPVWLPYGDVPRVNDIFPSQSTLGGINAPPEAVHGKGKEALARTRDEVIGVLQPTVRTIAAEGEAPRQVDLTHSQQARQAAQPSPRRAAPAVPNRSVYAQRQQQMNGGGAGAAAARRPAPAPPARPQSSGGGGGGARFCTKCGAKRQSDSFKFCGGCGNKF